MSEKPKAYKTAGAFRAALEARLQNRARAEGTDLQRLRRQVAFDRFLARLFSKGPKADYPWILKGGYAMELRTHTARTTKDIDLTLLSNGTPLAKQPQERREQVRTLLQEAAAAPFDDFFEFLVGETEEDLDGAPEGGSRYPVQARMDGRDFARFHVDVGIGDEVLDPVEVVTGEDWLGFGGVAKERQETARLIEKERKRLRRVYPEIHGKVVDFVTHTVTDGVLYVSVRFMDGTNFSIRYASEMFVVGVDLSDWKTGNMDILRQYMKPIPR